MRFSPKETFIRHSTEGITDVDKNRKGKKDDGDKDKKKDPKLSAKVVRQRDGSHESLGEN